MSTPDLVNISKREDLAPNLANSFLGTRKEPINCKATSILPTLPFFTSILANYPIPNKAKTWIASNFVGEKNTLDVVSELLPNMPKSVVEIVSIMLAHSENITRYPFSQHVDLEKRNNVRTHSLTLVGMSRGMFAGLFAEIRDRFKGAFKFLDSNEKLGRKLNINDLDFNNPELFKLLLLVHDALPEALGETGHYDLNQTETHLKTTKDQYEGEAAKVAIMAAIHAWKIVKGLPTEGQGFDLDLAVRIYSWSLNMVRVPKEDFANKGLCGRDLWRSYSPLIPGEGDETELVNNRRLYLDQDTLFAKLETFNKEYWKKLLDGKDQEIAKLLYSLYLVECGEPEKLKETLGGEVDAKQALRLKWWRTIYKMIDHMEGNLYKGPILQWTDELNNSRFDHLKNELNIVARNLYTLKGLYEEAKELNALDEFKDLLPYTKAIVSGGFKALVETCKAYYPEIKNTPQDTQEVKMVKNLVAQLEQEQRFFAQLKSFKAIRIGLLMQRFTPENLFSIFEDSATPTVQTEQKS